MLNANGTDPNEANDILPFDIDTEYLKNAPVQPMYTSVPSSLNVNG